MNLESVLFYEYDQTNIQYNEKSPERDGYLKTSFISPPNHPVIHYNNTNYKTETLYIFKNIHKEFPECQGVLVIEHSPITNGFQKIYMCFPLRTDKTSFSNKTLIDSIFETGPSTMYMMNYMTPDMEFIGYENKGIIYSDLVVLSNKPILIKTDLSALTKPPTMFSDHTDDFIIIRPERMMIGMHSTEGMTEGMNDDVPVYCTPVDDSGTELEANLTIPVLGKYSETLQSSQIIFQVMNYVGAFVLFGIITGITPLIYVYVILKLVGSQGDDDTKKGRTTAIVILFAVWFGLSFLLSFTYAKTINDTGSSLFNLVVGLFFFFLFLCFAINVLVFHKKDLSLMTSFEPLFGFIKDPFINIKERGGELLVYVVVCGIIGVITGMYSNPAYVPLYIVYFLPIVIIIYQLSGIKSGGILSGMIGKAGNMANDFGSKVVSNEKSPDTPDTSNASNASDESTDKPTKQSFFSMPKITMPNLFGKRDDKSTVKSDDTSDEQTTK